MRQKHFVLAHFVKLPRIEETMFQRDRSFGRPGREDHKRKKETRTSILIEKGHKRKKKPDQVNTL